MDEGSSSAVPVGAATEPQANSHSQQLFPCPGCGQTLTLGTLACPHCQMLVYRERLQQLATEAMRLEPTDPVRAAMLWQQCLALLPPDSQQYAAVYQRIGALAGGWPAPSGAGSGDAQALGYGARPRGNDPWPLAAAKTIGSMALSVLVYAVLFHQPGATMLESLLFSVGFVLLILVHEMGHVTAMWYYKLSASPPIFIPFVGALINLRQNPPNAKVEAIVGIGGPVFGTIGSLACLAIYQWVPMFHNGDMLTLANFGFFLNLFNLIPVPPLDGGRVTAAVSPWIWIAGLAGLALMFVNNIRHGNFAIIPLAIILVYGLPRVLGSISSRVRNSPYYRIGARASWTIGIAYLALAGLLFAMKVYSARMGQDLL